MPYLGNIPATQFAELKYQDFTGGTGTSFTLNDPVGSAQELEVFVNNVRQEPGVAYTVSGTTLTMTGSIVASDDFYVVFQGKSTGTATHPATQNLTAVDGTFTGDLTVDTNTLHVDASNNRVGVGTAAPAQPLHFKGGAVQFENTQNTYLQVNTSDTHLYTAGSHPLRLGTNSTERIRILSGGGLTFNGDTAAANALNDYEEGTFTPTLSSSFYSGTLTIEGFYRKIGSQVFVVCHARATTSISLTSSGSSFISNMPFSMENVGSIGGYYAASWSNAYTGGTFGNGLAAYGNLYSGQTISMGANQTVNVCATYFTTA